uniref:Methyltransferase n=1 Tax=uncultured bacterium contig00004 TaxID=1181496 RepID=A0A806KAC7_9BACT|nr:methyltransferase [uncultured bacterium contig00004]
MDLQGFDHVAKDYDYFISAFYGNSNDFEAFHISLAEEYGKDGILDIACGTGALTIPLAKAGYDITALDLSALMIEEMKKKLQKENLHVDVFTANMSDFNINRRFSLAIIARTGFMYLLTAKEQKQALLNIREHLTDGGVLTLNTFQPNPVEQAENMNVSIDEYHFCAEYINHEGKRECISRLTAYDYITQVMHGSWKFETFDGHGNVSDTRICTQTTRHTYRQEMEYLFELCGYEILDVYNNYCREAAKENFIWVVKKIT